MHRRDFLLLTAAVSLAPALVRAAGVDYTPGLVDRELAAGKTLFVDFAADWCSTCAAQERAITALRAENPAYDAALTFVRVDWDQYANDPLTQRLNIPRRSTLVVLKGDAEIGRIVAGTRRDDIRALMDAGLAAATA
jgi:thiol-disulfide isomerase/thioredoxin